MSEIFDAEVGRVWLIGGEPLLHPRIIEFMETARENFPKANVLIFTNGLLLPKMKDEFWERCRELDIELKVTQYPVNFDYQAMKNKADSHNVIFKFYNDPAVIKTSWKYPLDLDGKCDPYKSFINCSQANRCITLSQGGNMYTCNYAAHIDLFNHYFGLSIGESKRDYINIYQESDPRKILRFFSEPIPMCRFCDVSNRIFNMDWETSKKQLNEWTI
jgi:MoaA/NifB/PqqE/SkfB family radical SAM enzyme